MRADEKLSAFLELESAIRRELIAGRATGSLRFHRQ
jgi:hypothetical protein